MKIQQAIALKLYSLAKNGFTSLHKFPLSRNLTLALAKRQIPQMWQVISVEPYNVCDLRCKMCPYIDMTRKKEQMSLELYQKIINDSVQSGINFLNLSFYNEPLLDSLLFKRICYAKSKRLFVQFFSNGKSLTQDKISKILEAGVDRIIFSFDGATKQTYEKIRVGSDFEKTKNNIIELIQQRKRRALRKPFIVIGLVAQEDNYDEVKEFQKLWGTLADLVTIWQDDNRKQSASLLGESKFKPRYPYPCTRLLHDEVVVMSNGKVPLCCRDYDGSVILGDLNKQTLGEVRNSAVYKEISQLQLSGKGDSIPLCKNCDSLYTCHYGWWLRYFSRIYPLSQLSRRLRELL